MIFEENLIEIKTFTLHLILATTIIFTETYTYQNVEHTHASEAAGYNYYNRYQCTWRACQRRIQLGKSVSNQWGNAENWYYRAQRAGYRTGHKPKRYAIMQSTAGYYGHVAIVERVYSSGKILASEYNYNRPLAYNTRYINASAACNYNYIY